MTKVTGYVVVDTGVKLRFRVIDDVIVMVSSVGVYPVFLRFNLYVFDVTVNVTIPFDLFLMSQLHQRVFHLS
jgi:hypothetical protein